MIKWSVIIATCLILILAGLVQERSPYISGLISMLPVKALAILYFVYLSAGNIQETCIGMISGVLGTVGFLVSVYLLPFGFHVSILVSMMAWITIVVIPRLWK